MRRLAPKPGDLLIIRRVLLMVADLADQIDYSGIDLEPVGDDLRLMARDLQEVAEELADAMDHAWIAAREKRDDRRREELEELRGLIGGRP